MDMKTYLRTIGLAFLLLGVAVSIAHAQEEDFVAISKVLEAGSSKAMAAYLDKSVDLNIDGKEATYSKAQAEGILKRFFADYPVQSFEFNHKGASKSGLPYAIGQYNYDGGEFRVWIRLKKATSQYLIEEMSFIKK